MQITNNTFFDKNNGLHIPLSVANPVSYPNQTTPNGVDALNSLCIKIEKSILLNALGLVLYTKFKAITDLDLVGNERWKKLVKGDGLWGGLDNENSLIACRVYEKYVTENNTHLSATGNAKVNTENSTNKTPAYLIASANQSFISQYQSDYLQYPIISDGFTDWFGCDGLEQSLFGYLIEKQLDFPEWDSSKFKIYETKNTFGI